MGNKYFIIINNKIYGANSSAQGLYFTIDGGNGPVNPDAFVFKVNSGSNGKFSIKTNTSLTYDYNLTTSDGQTILNQTGNYEITFPNTNTDYIVEITGVFPHMQNGLGNPDSHKILDVLQWGNQPWVSTSRMFDGYSLSSFSATDVPDLSNVTDMSYMFNYSSFNGDISGWDVSNVTNMGWMFYNSSFKGDNGDIGGWDVSNVTTMENMFCYSSFNGDIGGWDVSNVTSMGFMFETSSFNGDIGGWNVSNVTDMRYAFGRSPFNQDISGWDVSNVTNMTGMFNGAASFNQDLSSWCVQKIPSKPNNFDNVPTSWTLPQPVWGTCPPEPEPPADISGGIKTIDGLYTVHTFKAGDTFSTTIPLNIEYLIVGGGGNGGVGSNASGKYYGGGGGAGGLLTNIGSPTSILAGSYPVVVGNGRQNSSFNSLTAIRGGNGGSAGNGGSGGSGGGAGSGTDEFSRSYIGGAGTSGQGYKGGDAPDGTVSFQRSGGSGGGAGGVGIRGSGSNGSVGANGRQININGTPTYYAGGGGGAGQSSVGANGLGTGPNSGGGGHGVVRDGTPQAGFSGIVIIRYLTP